MLKKEKVKYTNKDNEQKEYTKMKVQGKLMDEGETITLVCLVDKGLEVRNINYKDKKTGEEKTFEVGSVFSAVDGDEEENSGFSAEFTGQALREIRAIEDKLRKGTKYLVIKSHIEIKKTGAVFPTVKIMTGDDIENGKVEKPTPSQQKIVNKIILQELGSQVDVKQEEVYEYTEFEEELIKTVKEQGENLDTLMYNLKLFKEQGKDIKDLNKERFVNKLK